MAFDPDAHLDSDSSFDPDAHLESDIDTSIPRDSKGRIIIPNGKPGVIGTTAMLVGQNLSGLGANILGGFKGLKSLVTGKGGQQAGQDVSDYVREHTITPAPNTAAGKISSGLSSGYNPLTWPSRFANLAGEGTTDVATKLGASPEVAGGLGAAVNTTIQAIPMVKGFTAARAASAKPGATSEPAASAKPNEPAPEAKVVSSEPVEGGVPKTAHNARAEILQRVGIEDARASAIEGNAKNAATDYQLSKFDEPAGFAAKAQFDSERSALQNFGSKIVERTGGTLGLDEDTLNMRGQAIASYPDALRDYFKTQKKSLYDAAAERSGNAPVTNLDEVDSLLNNKQFRNSLLAKNQQHLLNAVENQLQDFRENNPGGFSVQGAEGVRKWLNQIWTPENSAVIGQIKGAIDESVLKGAGEDLYGPARQMVQLEKATLDNPKGASKLFDVDPQTSINRTTSFDKMPDTLLRLPPEQFAHVLDMYRNAPKELKPQADAGLAEIKAHLTNKIVEAGSSTQGQWNAAAVSKVIRANSSKLKSVFADDPDALQQIQDLEAAGKILKVDQAYPGAAAQAANAVKRGMMTKLLTKGGGAAGAAAGAGAGSVLGPLGAGAGAVAGEAAGSSVGQRFGESAALKNWQQRTVKLSDLMKESKQGK